MSFYRPQTKLRKGNVFTPVCHSVHRGRAWQGACMVRVCMAGGMHGGHVAGEMATAADGTHPTGMHSC